MILALALAMSLGAWAQGHHKYTSAVSYDNLQPGDTLCEGASITGSSYYMVEFASGRYTTTATDNSFFMSANPSFGEGGVITLSNSSTFTPVDENGNTGDAWVVTEDPYNLTLAGITMHPAPGVERTAQGTWVFAMPGYNAALGIEYKDYPQLAWTLGGSAMPNDTTINLYRGFDADFFASLDYTTSQAFAQAYPVSPVRFGSTAPSVVTIDAQGHAQAVGTGTAKLYAVFDGDDDYRRDSVWFTLNLQNPDTLTLVHNDGGTLEALLGSGAPATALLTTINASSSFTNGTQNFDNIVTVTLEDVAYDANKGWYGPASPRPVEVAPVSGVTVTGYMLYFSHTDPIEYEGSSFEVALRDNVVKGGDLTLGSVGITKIEVYGPSNATAGSDSVVALNEAKDTLIALPGAQVQVVATAVDGNYLSAWSSDTLTVDRRDTATATITINAGESHKVNLTATFAQNPLLTLEANQGGTVTLDGYTPAVEASESIATTSQENTYSSITFNGDHFTISSPWGADGDGIKIPSEGTGNFATISSLNGEIITKVEFTKGFGSIDRLRSEVGTVTYSGNVGTVSGVNATSLDVTATNTLQINQVKVYYASTPETYPDGVTATANANEFRVLPGTQLSVTATPEETHYLVGFQGMPDTNSNQPVTKPLAMGFDPMTLTANFHAKPTLTLAQNESEWGSVELMGGSEPSESFVLSSGNTNVNGTHFTITGTDGMSGAGLWLSGETVTVASLNGENISRVEFHISNGASVAENITTTAGTNSCTNNNADGSITGINATSLTLSTANTGYTSVGIDQITVYYGEGNPAITQLTDNTYRVDYGAEVKVVATPDSAHYFVNWTGEAALNSNTAVEKTLTVTSDTTLTATFAAKPTLTLAQNESEWGSVTVPLTHEETLLTTITPDGSGNPVYSVEGKATLDKGSASYNSGRWQSSPETYLTVTAAEGINVTKVKFIGEDNSSWEDTESPYQVRLSNFAVWNGSNNMIGGAWGITSIEVYGTSASLPAGVAEINSTTYRVDYGQTVTVTAQASDELHHVQGWQDQNGDAIDGATMSDYFIGEPQNLFPAKSTVTLSNITADRTARALFGINSYDVTATASLDNRAEIGTGLAMGTVGATYVAQDGTEGQSVTPAASITYTAQGGSQSTLTATAEYGYVFDHWTVGTETYTTVTLTLTEAATVQAVFVPDTFEVSTFTATPADTLASAGTVTGADRYAYRTLVTLEETPATGYHFVNWSNTARTALGTETTVTVQLMQDTAIFAVMDTNVYNVTYTVQNDDRSEIGTGLPMGTVVLEGRHMHFLNDVLTVTPAYGYTFAGWADQNGNIVSTDNPFSFTIVSDTALEATFTVNEYTMTAVVDNVRKGSTLGSGSYPYLTPVTIEAVPIEGWHLWKWNDEAIINGGESAIGLQRTIVLTQDTTYTAYLAINQYNVVYSVNDEAMGSASSFYPSPYISNYDYTANFTYTENPGYHFLYWYDNVNQVNLGSADTLSIRVHEDLDITAYFGPMPYTLTVEAADASAGTVSGSGEYDYNTTVTIEATPAEGWYFTQWQDGNTENPRTVTVLGDATYTASFDNHYTVTVESGDEGRGSATGTATAVYGDEVEISATAEYGYRFSQWQDGNTENPRTVTVSGDETYTAEFGFDQFTVNGQSAQAEMGYVLGSTNAADYLSEVTLTAVAQCGYKFVSWDNGDTNATQTVEVLGDITLTANFTYAYRDTVEVEVPVHDTTYIALDTMYINVPDTNLVPVTLYDTTNVMVYDTTTVDVTLYDTTNVAVTLYDTTNVAVTLYDTTLVPVTVMDTTIVPVTIVDTTLAPVVVYDTTTIDVTLYDTTNVAVTVYDTTVTTVPVTVYDTTSVPVTVYDTTSVPVTVYDTTVTTVPVTVYDTTSVPVTVYDTTVTTIPVTVYDTTITTVPITVNDTTIVPVTEYDTTHVAVTVIDSTLVPITDTLWLTEYIHDTVYIEIHDTVYIHDTIFVGIDDVESLNAKIYANNGQIVVEGADGNDVVLYDVTGRILAKKRDEYTLLRFDIPASGTYLVKIGNHAARRIVMIR